MARPLRIAYPYAWYHVLNRARRSERIFSEKSDYHAFVELLEESAEMWNLRVAAYCLMDNHYHILIQTPEANISRAMRHIDGVYTQRYNRAHSCDGQLFRGRYKSILVDGDSYLLQLVRYIHRNPVKARIVRKPEDYMWSSHKGYLSISNKWKWLHKEFIFSLLTEDRSRWVNQYRRFVASEKDADIAAVLEAEKWPVVLGPEKFIDWVKGKYYASKTDPEIIQTEDLLPTADHIKVVICKFYKVDEATLYESRRGEFNEPRNVTIYMIRKLRRDDLQLIAETLRAKTRSSISSALERMRKRMIEDPALKARVDKIVENISRGHETT